MNILFLTLIDFDSLDERNIYTDLIREFVKNKEKVYIISPFEKKINKEEKLIEKKGYSILKLKIGNILKTNLVEKGFSMLNLEGLIKKGMKNFLNNVKFDLVIYSTPPITFYSSIKYIKNRDNCKSYLLLKDIFPQNAVDLGILRKNGFKGIIYKYFKHKEGKLYKISDYIGCMSERNVKFLIENNKELVSEKSIGVCPNSIEPINLNLSDQEKKNIREKYKIPDDKVVFIYGGNLGKPQGIDYVIECLKENENQDEAFIAIIGSGTEYNKLKKYFENNNPKNSILYSNIKKEDYGQVVNSCDVGLIFLDNKFTIPNFPSRLLSYLEAKIPVIISSDVNTDIGEIAKKNNFGYWCESKKSQDFMELINEMVKNREKIKEMGLNGRKFLEENYTTEQGYNIIMEQIKE